MMTITDILSPAPERAPLHPFHLERLIESRSLLFWLFAGKDQTDQHEAIPWPLNHISKISFSTQPTKPRQDLHGAEMHWH
eukprot:4070448-Amphidinium_carterae.1